jgi:hypothetical protein
MKCTRNSKWIDKYEGFFSFLNLFRRHNWQLTVRLIVVYHGVDNINRNKLYITKMKGREIN